MCCRHHSRLRPLRWNAERVRRRCSLRIGLVAQAVGARGHADALVEHAAEVRLGLETDVARDLAKAHLALRQQRLGALHPQLGDVRMRRMADRLLEHAREMEGAHLGFGRELVYPDGLGKACVDAGEYAV